MGGSFSFRSMLCGKRWAAGLCLALGLPVLGWLGEADRTAAQQLSLPFTEVGVLPQISRSPGAVGIELGGDSNAMAHDAHRLRLMNVARQQAMENDAEKLLRLAGVLNEQIAAENNGELNPEQLRRLAEIEKLARSVREKMATAVGNNPALDTPSMRRTQ